jgi:exopolysaccharide biosynthesis polyprenyl glycosylphosphotransferase
VTAALISADVVSLMLALLIATVALESKSPIDSELWIDLATFAALLPLWILGAALFKLYAEDGRQIDHSTVDDLARVFLLMTVGAFLFSRLAAASFWPVAVRSATITLFWALVIVIATAARALTRWLLRRRPTYRQKTLVVGAGDVGQTVAHKLLQHSEYRLDVVGFVDDDPKELRDDLGGLAVVGSVDELPRAIHDLGIERVVIAFSRDSLARSLRLVREMGDLPVTVEVVPRLFESFGPNVDLDWLEAIPLLTVQRTTPSTTARVVKRGMDVVGAALGILLTVPLFVLIAWRIARDSPGPVIFKQTRLGRDMEHFTILKFRTMQTGTDDSAHRDTIRETMKPRAASHATGLYKAPHGDAITLVGSWLRATSLDELPQLVNVLRGEMSLVGPRPSLPYEVDDFEPHHFERFAVAPGLTGLWQVRARALTSWREAVEMDVAYVRNWSLSLDLQLLCRTPSQLVRLKTR